jgi:hypothetical protein
MRFLRFELIGGAMLAVLAFLMLAPVAGRVEGYVAPVVSDTRLLSVVPVGETRSRISGESRRIRDCSFVDVEFRLIGQNNYAVADLELEEASKVRERGWFSFGPWLVQLTPEQLSRSQAVVRHQCHAFWLTESVFYPTGE